VKRKRFAASKYSARFVEEIVADQGWMKDRIAERPPRRLVDDQSSQLLPVLGLGEIQPDVPGPLRGSWMMRRWRAPFCHTGKQHTWISQH
jgi:hypothetical protein